MRPPVPPRVADTGWWKTGVVYPRFFLGGAIIFFTIATLMAFAFLVGVVTSSTAVSIMATFAVFFLAAILSGHQHIEAALTAEWAASLVRGLYWALPKTGQLAQAPVDEFTHEACVAVDRRPFHRELVLGREHAGRER